ncbi:hypothetical protein WD_0779 [Wolbachia endosymbiont of Drosophila melanogaster]|nr:hypothetical protein WD_0779 [Wolbachia endosymbiont of Drosophila melanogaster]
MRTKAYKILKLKYKNLLDKLRQLPYHDSEAIVFAFANLQIKR